MSVLEVRGLVKRYAEVLAVDHVEFQVERGQVCGLLGPNGSGKTTTLSCALGLLAPTAGEIRVLGEPAQSLHRTRGRVGVVFDTPAILRHVSVAGNLAYARRLRGHSGGRSDAEALELVGMTALAGRRAGRLSLGQTKRMSIAMALAGAPEFLVLDEPLSGLDPIGVREILRLVQDLARSGLTILFSSHRLLDVEPVLSHAVVLLNGKIVARGSIEELCGAGDRHVVLVDDVRRASECIKKLEGASVSARPKPRDGEGAGAEITVDAGRLGPAALNRALVEAGVGVSSLRSARTSLAQVFEQLVDAVHAEREA